MNKVDQFLGIPFKNRGRDKQGCDCWGLVMLVYESLDKIIPDFKISCEEPLNIHQAYRNSSSMEDVWRPLRIPRIPSVAVFSLDIKNPFACNHLGVAISGRQFLHTMQGKNSCLEKFGHPFWKQRLVGFYEYIG